MKRLWQRAMLAALVSTGLLCGPPAAAQVQTASVTGGQVQGVLADGITAFKGIPFAAPPLGNQRWKAPQPVMPWNGIKQADHFGPSCMQDPAMVKRWGASMPSVSEDCLYLNLWTPARSAHERLPVMVWVYGGGFDSGMTSASVYDGTHLASKGVVLVSVAYRVGVLGFLAHAALSAESPHHVSGNYGLLDVIAALQWVRANAGKFGGDPARVTIFGESAGGGIVGMLAASPLARGLFQRAISESGGAGDANLRADNLPAAHLRGEQFLAKLGARDIAAGRALAAARLVKKQGNLFGVVDDGYVLPRVADWYEMLDQAARLNPTPLLLGTNSDEGALLAPPGATPESFETQIRAQFRAHAAAILALYPHATAAEAERAARDVDRDAWFGWEAWVRALLYSQRGTAKTYLYYFDRRSPQAPLGPTHTAEIGYVFGNLVSPVSGAPFALTRTPGPADIALSEQIQSYWVNFAKTGDPNSPGLAVWPAFSAASQQALYLDEHVHIGPVPNLRQVTVFDSYAQSQRNAAKSSGGG